MNYTLDACALLAFLNDEEGADTIEELLDRAIVGDVFLFMSIINLLEVYYGELRDKGAEVARTVLDMVRQYPITIINTISEYVFFEAARLKAAYKLSLADAIGLGTAIELSAQFVTADHHELEKVEHQEALSFVWLPPRPHK
jgi:PIN domain nuclease of toxin-antitoxin system